MNMKKAILIIIGLIFFSIIMFSDNTNSSNNDSKVIDNKKVELSAAEILGGYKWCWGDCEETITTFIFQSKGTFSSMNKSFGIGYREGKWIDKGNSVVDLFYKDGTKTSLIIKSNTRFDIGKTIYTRD